MVSELNRYIIYLNFSKFWLKSKVFVSEIKNTNSETNILALGAGVLFFVYVSWLQYFFLKSQNSSFEAKFWDRKVIFLFWNLKLAKNYH